jgi:hypothetical protein
MKYIKGHWVLESDDFVHLPGGISITKGQLEEIKVAASNLKVSDVFKCTHKSIGV